MVAYKMYHIVYIYDRDSMVGEVWFGERTLFTDHDDITVCVTKKDIHHKKPRYSNEGIKICW